MSESDSELQPYWVYFSDDTLEPIPVRAESRPDAVRIGEKYNGTGIDDYGMNGVVSAIGHEGGGDFSDVDDSEFITKADV